MHSDGNKNHKWLSIFELLNKEVLRPPNLNHVNFTLRNSLSDLSLFSESLFHVEKMGQCETLFSAKMTEAIGLTVTWGKQEMILVSRFGTSSILGPSKTVRSFYSGGRDVVLLPVDTASAKNIMQITFFISFWSFYLISPALESINSFFCACWLHFILFRYEYHWADGTNIKKPIKCSAPKYIDYLMTWVQDQLDDETLFPSKIGELLFLVLHRIKWF